MTIGVGFLCQDGIVLCADTQITYSGSHKYYDHKIYPHADSGFTTVFTFAGNPNLMGSFFDKFRDAMKLVPRPLTDAKVRNAVETVLSLMDVLDTDPDGLHLLCGIVVQPSTMRFIKTERKIVRDVSSRFDYVGIGDSSLLRYLARMLTQTPVYKNQQACFLATYLVLHAKTYIDGCGGDTDLVVLKTNGTVARIGTTHDVEQRLLRMEFLLNRVATYFFDDRISESEFSDHVTRFTDALQTERPDYIRQKP